MAIVYQTSDRVVLEEIESKKAVQTKYEYHGSFFAPCFSLPTDARKEMAVYSSTSNRVNQVVVGFYDPTDTQLLYVKVVRAFQVSSEKKAGIIQQLLKNKGVLDSEFIRLHAVTHGFTYSTEKDSQTQAFYSAELELPKSVRETFRNGKLRITDELNERSNMNLTDPGFAMNYRDAVLFGEQVFSDYGIEDIRMEGGVQKYSSAAECGFLQPRRRLFERDSKLRLGFNPETPIMRGVILHEIAHAIDLREFGGFSHGPSFVLVYCELFSKYTSLGFVECFDHFVAKGLKVANPIYSDQFFAFTEERRRHFQKLHREVVSE